VSKFASRDSGDENPTMRSMQNRFPLRLPRSVKAEAERQAKKEGVSINKFVATAVAEKLAVINTAEFFAERRNRAAFAAFDRILRRKTGEKPREGDEVG
jgi:HicB-like protein involved in pilus formation